MVRGQSRTIRRRVGHARMGAVREEEAEAEREDREEIAGGRRRGRGRGRGRKEIFCQARRALGRNGRRIVEDGMERGGKYGTAPYVVVHDQPALSRVNKYLCVCVDGWVEWVLGGLLGGFIWGEWGGLAGRWLMADGMNGILMFGDGFRSVPR